VIELDTALKQIRSVWSENCTSGPSVSLDRLPASVAGIFAMLNTAIVKRDPNAGLAAPVADGAGDEVAAAPAMTAGQINSVANAGRALAAVATYFGRSEPSNPALMLVRQAQDLLGKSFLEVIQLLVPDQVSRAAVLIGREQFFDLPIERLATAAGNGPTQAGGDDGSDGQAEVQFDVRTRSDALTLLDQVGLYFRTAEPSSPIPFFTERARDLATRDFLSVLKVLLPADTLKTI
jgi:type VI secretion system protein ImpA